MAAERTYTEAELQQRLELARSMAREQAWRDLMRRFSYAQRKHLANLLAHDFTITAIEFEDAFGHRPERMVGAVSREDAQTAIRDERERRRAARTTLGVAVLAPAQPLDMVLHCPKCHTQHVDEPDERTPGWVNPPHRSHLCHACGTIWRPADVATNGVREVKTRGKADTWPVGVAAPARSSLCEHECAEGRLEGKPCGAGSCALLDVPPMSDDVRVDGEGQQ